MADPKPRRLFARLRRNGFDLECPHCGKVYIIRPGTKSYTEAGRRVAPPKYFDDRTSIFRCTSPRCQRAYVVGLAFYPLGWRKPEVWARVPVDTIPTLEQAEALEALESARLGIVMHGRVRDPVTGRWPKKGLSGGVNVAPGCTCPDGWGGGASVARRDPHCPRHGGEPGEGGNDATE